MRYIFRPKYNMLPMESENTVFFFLLNWNHVYFIILSFNLHIDFSFDFISSIKCLHLFHNSYFHNLNIYFMTIWETIIWTEVAICSNDLFFLYNQNYKLWCLNHSCNHWFMAIQSPECNLNWVLRANHFITNFSSVFILIFDLNQFKWFYEV